MNFDKVRLIDSYICKNNTGRSHDFADKVNISRGMLYRYLKFMKNELKAPIIYNKIYQTYQYKETGKLCINGWERITVTVKGDSIAKKSSFEINITTKKHKSQ